MNGMKRFRCRPSTTHILMHPLTPNTHTIQPPTHLQALYEGHEEVALQASLVQCVWVTVAGGHKRKPPVPQPAGTD